MDKLRNIVALLDFDGVVMDTETQYTVYWDKVGKQFFPDQKDFGSIIKGMTLTQIYEKYFDGMEAEQAAITGGLNDFESEMTFNYIPGVVDFMRELHSHKVKIAIVTSSNEKKMSCVYTAHPELKSLVDKILTAEMFTRSKPAPDCFLLGAEVFDTVVENCVVFEDSYHGLQAGRASGMPVVGLATTNSFENIKDKCDVAIADFTSFGYTQMIDLLNGKHAK